jgi:two-component system phosphate regulon sensor histidine kinase PhoR
MKEQQNVYRKNFSLIISFLILISVTFIIALFIAYGLTSNYVENEFASKKIDVLEQTIKPYNDFFQNRIPEITFYQGYLDSTSAAKYSGSVFNDYAFVTRIIFYDVQIGTNLTEKKRLGIAVKSIYEYHHKGREVIGSKKQYYAENSNDFNMMANKLNSFVAFADTAREPTQGEKFKTFYDIQPEKIGYLNIPRREEVKRYRELQKGGGHSSVYKQNLLIFILNQYALKIKNTHPELYRDVAIKPVVYDPLDNENSNNITTEVAFPGAFSDYKLYFSSPKSYLIAETNRRFMPIGAMVLLIYVFLVLIGWLIYRNLNVNLKLFKLQYDFINNFTHEFKTPISVIKIAGSNLRGDSDLSDRQRKHYGKILDEEADKLNELMNKLLSFTQLENKSMSIKKEEIDIEDFVNSYKATFKIKYPDLKLNYKVEGITHFYTDPVLLGSIFQNLIENAYKYSNPGHRELFIYITFERRNIIFSFTDKGIGIAKGEINNIFKKFYRVENQYNQNGSVGLGLAFCKELANFMNGDIMVNSKINAGSEFIVTLPYESAE